MAEWLCQVLEVERMHALGKLADPLSSIDELAYCWRRRRLRHAIVVYFQHSEAFCGSITSYIFLQSLLYNDFF